MVAGISCGHVVVVPYHEKATVVVVGGGPAGSLFAKTMQGHADVVLVDP